MRELPQSLAAEAALLGGMVLDPSCLGDLLPTLSRDLFFHEEHQILFDTILALYERNSEKGVDGFLVRDELERRGQMEAIGGTDYLQRVIETVPSSANATYYADIVIEHAWRRLLIVAAREIADAAYDTASDVREAFDAAQARLLEVSERGSRAQEPAELPKLLIDLYAVIEKRQQGVITGLPTGFYELDDMMGGLHGGEMIVVAGRPSMGKQQPVDTPVLAPQGWRPIGSLRAGDCVVGADGKPTEVTGVFPQGVQQAYRVTFRDGTSTECGLDHLWSVAPDGGRSRKKFSSKSLRQLLSLGITRKKGDNRHGAKWRVPIPAPVETETVDLPIHPYLLGVLIGDGCTLARNLRFSNPDLDGDIHQQVAALLPPDIHLHANRNSACAYYDLRGSGRQKMKDDLIRLGLDVRSSQKAIPSSYLMADMSQRLDLLRGLMDTDGGCLRKTAMFYTTSERLAAGVAWLVRSLGGVARVRMRDRTEHSKPVEYHVRVTMSQCPFLTQRKAATWRPKKPSRYIWSVDRSRVVEQVCIQVAAADGLYITNDFIVTHNSALALNIADHIARIERKSVLIFSLEMGREEIAARLLCGEAGVDMNLVRKGMVTTDGYALLLSAMQQYEDVSMLIYDEGMFTPLEIRAMSRRMQRRRKLDLIIVDYVQLMHGGRKEENRQLEISGISRHLKGLARELNVPVIAVSQLNRGPEARENKRPRMSDLRESGSLEQDADVVMLMYRQDYYSAGEKDYFADHTAEVNVAKQRNGPTGLVELIFREKIARFQNKAQMDGGAVPF